MLAIECHILLISFRQIVGTMSVEVTILRTVRPVECYHQNSLTILFGGLVQTGYNWIRSTGLCRRSCRRTPQHLKRTKFVSIPWLPSWNQLFLSSNTPAAHTKSHTQADSHLTVSELRRAETHLILAAQTFSFESEMNTLLVGHPLPQSSCLKFLRPLLDASGVLRVGGQQEHSGLQFDRRHPIILHARHSLARIIIRCEHLRLLHAGPTILLSSIARRFHIIGGRKIVRSIVRDCAICHCLSAKP